MRCKMKMTRWMKKPTRLLMKPNVQAIALKQEHHFTTTTTHTPKGTHFATTVEKMGMSCTHAKIQLSAMESLFTKTG